jgi:uncharacterized protein YjiS (DUF1127 family)
MHIPYRRSWCATSDLASPVPPGRHATGLPRLARQLWHWILRYHRTRLAEAELAAMSDRMLADIGVSRSKLARVTRRGRGW